jgi:hypothetical protein
MELDDIDVTPVYGTLLPPARRLAPPREDLHWLRAHPNAFDARLAWLAFLSDPSSSSIERQCAALSYLEQLAALRAIALQVRATSAASAASDALLERLGRLALEVGWSP